MIKYKLECKNCKIIFDSWFASSKEYEKLKKKKFLICHCCNSQHVEKTLMAPQLINTKKITTKIPNTKKFNSIKKNIKDYQKFVKDNFKYVGENFTQEVRLIHYNEKKPKKNIYGNASKKDFNELKEEGIDVQLIPWINDKDN